MKSRPNFDHPLFVLHFSLSLFGVVNISSIFVKLKFFLASQIDIFVNGSSKETSQPTGDGTFCGLSGNREVKGDRVEWM